MLITEEANTIDRVSLWMTVVVEAAAEADALGSWSDWANSEVLKGG